MIHESGRYRPPAAHELTPREWDVLSLLAQGHVNKTIANKLIVSVKTVDNHVHHILRKLGVRNRTQAAYFYLMHGREEKNR